MVQTVSNPNTTFNIVPRDQTLGTEDIRDLIVGQKTSGGSAAAGELFTDLPKTNAEINSLFGANSHLAMVCRAYRRKNPITNVDVIPLADGGSATAATAKLTLAGTVAAPATITVVPASDIEHRYTVDLITGDTASAVRTKINAQLDLGTFQPFTYADDDTSGTHIVFTAANGGKVANNWPIAVIGNVPGLTITATGWTGGATDPTLTNIFDVIANIRYTGVVWPAAYPITEPKNLLDARKNVDNDVMDGRAFVYINDSLANAKTAATSANSSEIVYLTNKPNAYAQAKGPHVLAPPDTIAAEVCALRSYRLEPDVSISHIVANNETLDQFGGVHLNSLPYFNTPLAGHLPPIKGSGYTNGEQLECEASGLAVVGGNQGNGSIILGDITTTWLTDAAGNEDDTWKYLNWRDTHGAIREIFQRNFKKRFAQHRLTVGTPVAGMAYADEKTLRGYALELYGFCGNKALVALGRDSRVKFEQTLFVQIDPSQRKATLGFDVVMISQLGAILGTVKFSFNT